MTSMMKNVEEAFNRGGGAETHKPGHISAKEETNDPKARGTQSFKKSRTGHS